MTRYLTGGVLAAALIAPIPAIAQVVPDPTASQAVAAPVSINRMQRAAKAPKTRAEIQTAVARRFARMDADHDGFVSTAEVEALQAKRGERLQQRAAKRASNRDPAAMFARLDSNKDGTITRAEADAARTARMVARGRPAKAHAIASGGLFGRADSNRDGNISRAEFDAAPRKAGMRGGNRAARAGGGRLLRMGDANKDGRVSLAEAQQAALVRFDRSDLNRDGTVTPEERRQRREQRRAQRQPG